MTHACPRTPLGAQVGALVLLWLVVRTTGLAAAPLSLALVQGALAVPLAAVLRSDRWWLALHLVFAPAIVLAMRVEAPAWIYLLPLCALLLVYGTSFRSQVPLFLSNRRTVERFAAWLGARGGQRILDAGSGTGSFSLRLARLRRDCRWRAASRPSCRRGSAACRAQPAERAAMARRFLATGFRRLRCGVCVPVAGTDAGAVAEGRGGNAAAVLAGQQQLSGAGARG